MSDNAVPNHDAEAERLEAALERIAALARRRPRCLRTELMTPIRDASKLRPTSTP